MRAGLGQAQERAIVRPAPEPVVTPVVVPTTKEIPYDYVATFTLRGERGNRVQDVINISVEGAFVAVAIGYSFIPARQEPLAPTIPQEPAIFLEAAPGAQAPVQAQENQPRPTTWARIIARTIAEKLQLEEDVQGNVVAAARPETINQLETIIRSIMVDPRDLLRCLLVKLCGIDFRYSIIDSGTGRELQNLAIHNIAGLGKADGDRPFRPLAKPMLFLPRSTIRVEVEEISEGPIYGFDDSQGRRVGAQLFIVLHGYKMLGYTGTTVP